MWSLSSQCLGGSTEIQSPWGKKRSISGAATRAPRGLTMKLSSPGPIIVKNSLPWWGSSLPPNENRANGYKMRPVKSTQVCFLDPLSLPFLLLFWNTAPAPTLLTAGSPPSVKVIKHTTQQGKSPWCTQRHSHNTCRTCHPFLTISLRKEVTNREEMHGWNHWAALVMWSWAFPESFLQALPRIHPLWTFATKCSLINTNSICSKGLQELSTKGDSP